MEPWRTCGEEGRKNERKKEASFFFFFLLLLSSSSFFFFFLLLSSSSSFSLLCFFFFFFLCGVTVDSAWMSLMDLLTGWVIHFILFQKMRRGRRWRSLLRHCQKGGETQYKNEEKGYPGAAGTQRDRELVPPRAATPIDVTLFSL